MYKSLSCIAALLVAIGGTSATSASPPAIAAEQSNSNQVTVPLILIDNRPFVDITLKTNGSAERQTRFLVDTGGGGFIIARQVAEDLGIEWSEETFHEEGSEFARPLQILQAFMEYFELSVNPAAGLYKA